MDYVPSRPARERILVFGDAGVGKSHLILALAKRLPELSFRVAEVDWTTSGERLLCSPEFAGVENVEFRHAYPDEWTEQLELARWLQEDTGKDDWASFDSITPSWSAVQSHFIERMFPGQDADEYFMLKREQHGGEGRDLRGWEDWPYIKRQHDLLYKALQKVKGHTIITAEQSPLGEGEKKDDRQMFGALGFRPAGRKQLAYLPSTVIHLSRDQSGKRTMRTLKDRGRELVKVETTDFFRDYLIRVAGWKADTPTTPAAESSQKGMES